MPPLDVVLVAPEDQSGAYGTKAGPEAAAAGLTPAVANAVADALGVRLRQLPLRRNACCGH